MGFGFIGFRVSGFRGLGEVLWGFGPWGALYGLRVYCRLRLGA